MIIVQRQRDDARAIALYERLGQREGVASFETALDAAGH